MTQIKYQFKGQQVGVTYIVDGKLAKILQSFLDRGARVLSVTTIK
jgi:hypothetical protein